MLHATYVYTEAPPRRRLAHVRHARGPIADEDVERFLAAQLDLPTVYVRRDAALITVLCADGRIVLVTSELEAEAEAAEHARRVLDVPFDGELLAGAIRDAAHGLGGPVELTLHVSPPPPRRRRVLLVLAAAAVCASCAVGIVLVALAFSQSGRWS